MVHVYITQVPVHRLSPAVNRYGARCTDVLKLQNVNNGKIIWNKHNVLDNIVVVQQCGTVKLCCVAKLCGFTFVQCENTTIMCTYI